MSANVSILGNLGRAPETRTTPDGTFVANFSIASNTRSQFAAGQGRKRPIGFASRRSEIKPRTLAKYAKKGNSNARSRQIDCQARGSTAKALRRLVRMCCCKIFSLRAETKRKKQTAARHQRTKQSNIRSKPKSLRTFRKFPTKN